jgi:hypothetical protein
MERPVVETTSTRVCQQARALRDGKVNDSASKLRDVCWNCGEMGHFCDKCPEPVESSDEEGGAKKAVGVNGAKSE